MKPSTRLQITGIALGIIGIFAVGYFVNWPAALGIFAMIWGNNLENTAKQEND